MPYSVENIVQNGDIACYKQFLLFSENIVQKGEIACYKQFLLFISLFQKIGGILFYCCPSVCINLTWKLSIFPLLLN